MRERLVSLARQHLPASSICSVATGADAVAVFDRSHPDAVLLDLGLPDMTGLEVLEHIRRRGTTTEVVVFTNWAGPEMAARCHLLGANHFVSKAHDVGPVIEILRTITAPQSAAPAASSSAVPKSGSGGDRLVGTNPVSVLVVEDDDSQAELLVRRLPLRLPQGSSISRAGSQAEALDCVRNGRFEVVLLDLGLPDCDGAEAVVALRLASPAAAIIVLSAHDEDATIELAMQGGADDYFIKGELGADGIARAIISAAKRQRSARALTTALESRRRIMDSSVDVICTLDAAGRFVEVGAACERLWGYSREELIGRISTDWIAAAERSKSDEFLESVRRGATTHEFENQFVCKDGSCVDMMWSAVWSADDRLIYCVAHDITKRKSNEETLRSTIQSALDCIITIDETNTVLEFNPAAERTFGWSRAEALGRKFSDLIIPPEFREGHARGMAKLLQPDQSQLLGKRVEIRAMHANGTEFPAELSLVRLGTDRPARFTAFLRGITERVSARQKLEAQEEQYRVLFESSPNAMWVYDLKSLRILAVNHAAVDQYGYTREEFLGLSLLDLRPPEDSDNVINAISKEGAAARYAGTWTHLGKGARSMLVDVYSSPTIYEGIPARMAVLVDVTEQKRAEDALRRSELSLANAQRIAHLGNWDWNIETGELFWSEQVFELFGIAPHEFDHSYEGFLRGVHADDRSRVDEMLQVAVRGDCDYDLNHRILWRDGSIRTVHEHGEIARDASGRAVRMSGTVQDITARKNAEAAAEKSAGEQRVLADELQSEKERLVVAQAVAKIGSWETNLLDHSVLWSAETFRIFELEPGDGDATPERFSRLVHPEDRPAVDAAFAEALQTRMPSAIEHRIVMPDGRIKFVEERWQIDCAEDGTALCANGTCQDITERKQAEQAAARTLQRLSDAQRIGQMGDWEWEIATQAITWSPQVFTIFGREPKLAPPQDYEEYIGLYDATNAALVDASVTLAMGSGEAQEHEVAMIRPDGARVHLHGLVVPRKDETGQVIGLSGTVQDITARKRTEAAASRLLSVLEASLNEIYIFHADTLRFEYVNECALRNLGHSMEAMRAQTPLDLKPEFTADQFHKMIAPLRRQEKPKLVFETVHRRADASLYPVEVHLQLVRRGENEVFLAIINDITARKQAERTLVEQAEMLNLAHDAIVVRGIEDRIITFWNKGAEHLYGWTAAEAIGQRLSDLIYDDPEQYLTVAHALELSGEFRGEVHQVAKDGRRLVVSKRANALPGTAGRPGSVLIIQSDITEHRKLENQFLRAQRLESIGTLASGVAHDLNNVLAPILMSAPLLREEKLASDLKQKIIDTIEMSAERGAQIVKQVLTFARGVEGERVLVDPRHLIKEMAEIAQQTFPKTIVITTRYAERVDLVEGDQTQLHQVLLNLAVNARDAMPTGGKLLISAENLEVDAHYAAMTPDAKPGPHVLIAVSDTGTGIAAHIMEKMFDPFFTTKEIGKGSGLGLSTVLGIVKSHGGVVTAYSTPQGTTFRILLPAAAGQQLQVPEAESELPLGRGETILLVDDEPAICHVADVLLTKSGYKVLLADDGPAALAIFAQRQGEIAVVITDLLMPTMNGRSLARIIRKMNPVARIIVSSGREDHCTPAELNAIGISASLTKPYTQATLLRTLHELLHDDRRCLS